MQNVDLPLIVSSIAGSGYQYKSGYGTDGDAGGANSSSSTTKTTYTTKSSTSNTSDLYGEPKYAHGQTSAADRYGVGISLDSAGGSSAGGSSYDRKRTEGYSAGPGGVSNIKSTTEYTTNETTKSAPREYYTPQSYSPSKYSSSYSTSSHTSRPTAHSTSSTRYETEPLNYESKPRDSSYTTSTSKYESSSTKRSSDYKPGSYSTSTSSYSSDYKPSSYTPSTSDYKPSSYTPSTSDYKPSSYTPSTSDYKPSTYTPSTSDYKPSSYTPSTSDYKPSTYTPSSTDYKPSSYTPSTSDYKPSEYTPSSTDRSRAPGDYKPSEYTPSSTDRSRAPGDYKPSEYTPSSTDRSRAPGDDTPAGDKPTTGDSAPQKSGSAPRSAPSGDLSEPITMDGEDLPDDDFGDFSVEEDKKKPVEKGVQKPKSTDLSGEDVPMDDESGDIPSVGEDVKKPAHEAAPGLTLEGEDVPVEENGLPSVEMDQKKPVEKSVKPGDGLESADLPSEDIPMDDMSGIPSIDMDEKAPVKNAAPVAAAPADKPSVLDSEDLPMEEVPMDDESGLPSIDADKKKQVKDAAPVSKPKGSAPADKPSVLDSEDLPMEEVPMDDDSGLPSIDADKKKQVKDAAPVAKPKGSAPSDKPSVLESEDLPMEEVPMDDGSGLPSIDADKKKQVKDAAPVQTKPAEEVKPKVDPKKAAQDARDAKKKADEEAKAAKKAAQEKKIADAKKKMEEKKAAAAEKKKADEEAKKKADADAKKKAEEDAKKKVEEDAKKKAEEDAKKKAVEDAKKKPEEKKPEEKKPEEKKPEEKKPEEKKPEEKKPEEKKPEEKKPTGLTGKEKLLSDLPEDTMQAILRCIEGGEMDFPGLDLDISVTEAIKRNVAKVNLDEEQNIIINFFSSPSAKQPTSLKLNIKGEKVKAEVTNPRDGRVKLDKIEVDENKKPSKIHVGFTPQGKRSPLNFVFDIKDGVMSMTKSDLDPNNVYLYLTDADPIRKKLNPKEKRAKEAIISINLQDGKTHEVKLKYGKGDCLAEVLNGTSDCKVTKVLKDKKGDPELVTIAVTPKGCDKPMYLTFKIGDGVIDLVNIEYGGQPMPLKRGKDGSLQLTIPGLTPERIVELNMKLGPKDTDTSKVTLNFPDGKTCTATSDDKSTVTLVDFKYDDKGTPLSAVIDVTPKGKDKPMKFTVAFKEGVPTVTMVPGEEPEDEGQELLVRFKLSPDDKEPCEVKMVIKDGKLTATGDKKADVKVVSSKFDGKGEPTEIKLELIPKGGKPSLFFTCSIKDGDLSVSQDAPAKPATPASTEPAEPTEQELVVRFKLDPAKDPCVVKIGILGDECAAIGDKQATADVVDFKCSPTGDPEYIRLRLDPSDGSEGIFFVLRFIDGKLSVEQEDLPADVSLNHEIVFFLFSKLLVLKTSCIIKVFLNHLFIDSSINYLILQCDTIKDICTISDKLYLQADLGNMGLQHSSAEQSMVVRFKLSPEDPNPCEVVLRMTPENCTASSDGKANVSVMEYV